MFSPTKFRPYLPHPATAALAAVAWFGRGRRKCASGAARAQRRDGHARVCGASDPLDWTLATLD